MSEITTKNYNEKGNKEEAAAFVLDKSALSEGNTVATKVIKSEKVEAELGTFAVKMIDPEKVKAGPGTRSEKEIYYKKLKADWEHLMILKPKR